MAISPSKDCWSRYGIDANFRVLAEWLGPDFPRAMTFPELQWLSGAQEYRASGNFESCLVDPRQSRKPARPSSARLYVLILFSWRTATLIANAYLEAEIEQLTEAISTGFARGRMRKAPQRITKI